MSDVHLGDLPVYVVSVLQLLVCYCRFAFRHGYKAQQEAQGPS